MDVKNVWPEWSIEEKLGKGSYGTVYRAVRQEHGVTSEAAIKVISIPQDSSEVDSLRSEGLDMDATRTYLQSVVDDFVNEIQLMESFKGIQNIVSVEDYKVVEKEDEVGWDIFIRMELLTPFNTYICDKQMTEQEVIKLGTDICSALEICEQRNVIHRDIKPGNVFINNFGYFKLGDFGIARTLENTMGQLSQKGTFDYMAPEIGRGEKYDARVDIYSLGIMLYRLLNGNRLPFLDNDKQLLSPTERKAALDRRLQGEPLPKPKDASTGMANLLLRACAFDPAQRFSSASEMRTALNQVLAGVYKPVDVPVYDPDKTTAVRKAPTAPSAKQDTIDSFTPPKKKSKASKIIAILLVILVLLGAGGYAVIRFDLIDVLSGQAQEEKDNIEAIALEAEQLAEAGDISAALEKAQEGLDTYPDSERLQTLADDYSAQLDKQIEDILDEAEKLDEAGDSEGALAKVQDGLKDHPDSEALSSKVDEYMEKVVQKAKKTALSEAADFADKEDYASAMNRIEDAQDTYGEDKELQDAYEMYNKAYVLQVKEDAISKANEIARGGDYMGAIKEIKAAISKIGEDKELSSKQQQYEDDYVVEVIAEADSFIAEKDFDSAEAAITDALKDLPGNETLLKKEDEIEESRPKYFVEVCSPYESSDWYNDTDKVVTMGNENYGKAFSLHCFGDAYFNLNGKYTSLEFDYGHVDGTDMNEMTLFVYLDGNQTDKLEMKPGDLPKHYRVDLKNASQLKLTWDGGYSPTYGFANAVIE
ncbi:protein kinase [Acutalibacter muris]|uniref:Protein kinase n=1 Tax=Acutalibacter muris TaxID=1796620 RepID=A0A1Z2XST1_9FIRM|nr:protein kinase [Acutalibacter muris]ANU55305.1 hypothetical protein A4V00_15495 [Hungateiclostridiaceae bacterium KB18]ASB41459.1 hypothetical protein ADH66_12845 [Acutalibacter muris]QQR30717.1 protein kinase [Acutalibacter muris]